MAMCSPSSLITIRWVLGPIRASVGLAAICGTAAGWAAASMAAVNDSVAAIETLEDIRKVLPIGQRAEGKDLPY